ncbi:GntR family transcriptional regulator [Halosquirtibacter laminarini]|uniref:GntR family transcriptional regulator n=1 Tax=Halosquirtibacter laminarini TaxID=3374600 RepID=A0AC61NCX8_9BACT|nr:GntR family transcriptional regulator [Prolixibacteraceae bacterium]
MTEIGKINQLHIVKDHTAGIYLDGEDLGEILLPNRYVPENCAPGDLLEVFIYLDSEDRLVASTDFPKVMVEQFGFLEVKQVNHIGAFMDWGLPKDLLVPFKEQHTKMSEGEYYLVFTYLDPITNRIVATTKTNKLLGNIKPELERGDKVEALICDEREIGYTVIVNNKYRGMVYKNETFENIEPGDRIDAFVKNVREDYKIDLQTTPLGYKKVDDTAERLLITLQQFGGRIKITDKSDPETIKEIFGMSKKTFKKTLGMLYKQRKVVLEENAIAIVKEEKE